MADTIPPPPAGFTVDADPDAASSAPIPPPPEGFNLDGPAAPPPQIDPGISGAPRRLLAVAQDAAMPLVHGVGTLADIFTGTSPGPGSHAERWSEPLQHADPNSGVLGDPDAWNKSVSSAYDKIAGTGPMAETVKERVPQALEGIGTVLGARAPLEKVTPTRLNPSFGGAPASVPIPAPPVSATSTAGPKSMGAAQVSASPFTLTGQETGRGSPSFPQVKLAKNAGDVAPPEQSVRAGIVKEVLSDAGEDEAGIRSGVISGNEQTLRNEYQAAKNPTQAPANALMASQIGAEQRALPKFAQQRIDATGADPTLSNDYQRGETINGAFYGDGGLQDFLQQQKQKIFQAALDKNGASQIPVPSTDALFADPQFQAGLKLAGHENVASGASDLINLAKTVGFKDPVTGEQYAPGSVASYNAVTKAINRGWSPDNAVTVRAINGAINGDIAASGGGDLYQLGNKVHQLEKSLLSDSPGINKVFGDVDPNGVQTAKPFETIPQTLNNMPLDEWRHIHDTLDTLSRGQIRGTPDGMDPVPQPLQDAATRAKAEVEGSLAREVYAQGAGNAGTWSANAANKALNGRVGQKILDVAPPEEVRKFQTLNAAGQIMPGTHAYEGAGAQTARMGNEPGFVENYATKAGALVGAKTAGPAGMWLGEKAGAKVAGLTKARREAAHAANVRQTLRDNLNLAPDPNAPIITRATGGKVAHKPTVDELADRLYKRWRAAQKETTKATEPLLRRSDESITRALAVANEAI